MQVGTLLGARGSNVQSIRMASGARIKVQDSNPGQQERQVEVSGTVQQVSVAMSAVQVRTATEGRVRPSWRE